jgi:PAS domain S-box-containing protein
LDYAAILIPLKVFFAKLEYTGYNSALSLLAIFSLFYVGHDDLWKSKWAKAFFALPLGSILLAWTNDLHGWLWSGFIRSELGENTVIFEHGPGFVWAIIVGYLMVGVIVVNLWRASRQGAELSRRQARLLLLATFIPITGSLVYLLVNEYTDGIDWTSITFSISGLLFLIALYGTRFLDIIPIARRTTFEQMGDGVLVLDINNNVVDFNPAAQAFFEIDPKHLGNPINLVMGNWPEFVNLAASQSEKISQATIVHKERTIVFDIRATLLEDNHGQAYGKLIVFRDITEQHQTEHALGEHVKELKCIYDLSLLVEKSDISLDEILQGSVNLIAGAMQYPDQAYARLLVEDKSYTTQNYQDTGQKLSQEITVARHKVGMLEVGYLEDVGDVHVTLFLDDEKRLLEIMAERLGKIIQRIRLEGGRNLMSATLDVLPVGVCLNDEGGYYRIMNDAYCAIYEYDKEEMLGQHYSVIMPPDQIALANAHYARLLGGDVGIPVERKRQRKDGSIVYIEAVNALVEDSDGKKMVITTVREITERKQMEDALRTSEDKFNKAFHSSPNAILIIRHLDGQIVDVNEGLSQMTGYAREEFLEKSTKDITTLWANPREHEQIVTAVDTIGYVQDRECQFRKKSGEIFTGMLSSEIIQLNGEAHVLTTVHDVTKLKQAEQQLLQAQEQIVIQQRELARVEERQRMARDLHDSVNQSIHSMVLFSETLAATLAKNNLERAGHIMERLQESARQSLKETRLMLYELQAEDPGRSVNLVQDLEDRLARVERRAGVKTRFIQEGLLEHCPQEWHENLFWIAVEALNNALKHAQAREVQVVLRFSPECIELEVSDNGIGFDPAQVSTGGLGLENLQARADIIGGILSIESEPGQGTTVRLSAEIQAD